MDQVKYSKSGSPESYDTGYQVRESGPPGGISQASVLASCNNTMLLLLVSNTILSHRIAADQGLSSPEYVLQ